MELLQCRKKLGPKNGSLEPVVGWFSVYVHEHSQAVRADGDRLVRKSLALLEGIGTESDPAVRLRTRQRTHVWQFVELVDLA